MAKVGGSNLVSMVTDGLSSEGFNTLIHGGVDRRRTPKATKRPVLTVAATGLLSLQTYISKHDA